jgi:hypothetical protein
METPVQETGKDYFHIDGGDTTGKWGGLERWPAPLLEVYNARIDAIYDEARTWLISKDDTLFIEDKRDFFGIVNSTDWQYEGEGGSDAITVWNDTLGVECFGFDARGTLMAEIEGRGEAGYLTGKYIVITQDGQANYGFEA